MNSYKYQQDIKQSDVTDVHEAVLNLNHTHKTKAAQLQWVDTIWCSLQLIIWTILTSHTTNVLSFLMNVHSNIKRFLNPGCRSSTTLSSFHISHWDKQQTFSTGSQSEACVWMKPAFTVRSCKVLYIKHSLSVPLQVAFYFDLRLWLHVATPPRVTSLAHTPMNFITHMPHKKINKKNMKAHMV